MLASMPRDGHGSDPLVDCLEGACSSWLRAIKPLALPSPRRQSVAVWFQPEFGRGGSVLTEENERETTEGEAHRLRKDLGGGAWVGTVAGEVPCFAADLGRARAQGSGSEGLEALDQCFLELGIGGIRRDRTRI